MRKLTIVFFLLCAFACKGPSQPDAGLFKNVQGDVTVERSGKVEPAKVGDRFVPGDTVRTGENGIAIIAIKGTVGQAELQPNSVFRLNLGDQKTEVLLDKGNMWLQVQKATSREEFTVRTPTTVAGVRGTKFYTFQNGDTVGVCYCEGDVDFAAGDSKSNTYHKDTLVFTRNGKTVSLTADEVPGVTYEHNHSLMDGSPLGQQSKLTPEMKKKIFDAAEKKFKELK
ncbi:MAG TPA: FecR family protein [Leptospiraceae bacterium]|jgi:hypothetical protein|nr:FecR family protein [Leptospiraceae bacterium]HMX55225.1 FecR family protein [Leptospiraceae bacterium]HMZ36352.1 FecR family protein [Leptospiraceae bacterium]HNL02702.1 FecR family protein [Leptospiraceae bacterium]HNL68569.1 FecR family protein [Leptospiraceae bacterium]